MKGKWGQGYDYKFAGELETQGETFASAGQMALVALFLVFAVLAWEWEAPRSMHSMSVVWENERD